MADAPFAEGAMRYAFYLEDLDTNYKYVAKLPKHIAPKYYNMDVMKNDIEA